ncbi:MAG TPA: ring-cleaving dioxygenase, partial [Gemmatimonadaceae bacterium]|nr:ring-cleaving dioxygenase [Gemmatimonadaceae bacterium]
GLLGLRLVKRTVNYDDPGTYHFYFGDGVGTPGSILTFFPWPGLPRGRQGTAQATVISFAIAPRSLGYWVERFVRHSVPYSGPTKRDGAQVIELRDPDGLILELVTDERADERPVWGGGGVHEEHAMHGFHSVTLWEDGYDDTADLLTQQLGFRLERQSSDELFNFAAGDGGPGTRVTVRVAPAFWRGATGVGTVHHVAFRAADDAAQLALRDAIHRHGCNSTPVIDRTYFRSVYFHEPGGVLFEIATDAPGFTVDEPVERLGTQLMLPPRLEGYREQIERQLPPIHEPGRGARMMATAFDDVRVEPDASPHAAALAPDRSSEAPESTGEAR